MPSVARMISLAEKGTNGTAELLADLFKAGGRCRVVGITGSAGTGKSTLVAALARVLRARGSTVGILAIDPTSPISGGSILGDRIRMSDLTGDPGVFIRSMATRGSLGGLSRAAADAVTALDAAGIDVVLIETVGVGQDEVDVMAACHTTVVVCVPGLGDGVQALKAGLLEIADVYCVNKADLPGADGVVRDLRQLLSLGTLPSQPPDEHGWKVPVVSTVALQGQGAEALAQAIDDHHAWLVASGAIHGRERAMAVARIRNLALRLLLEDLEDPSDGAGFDALVEDVVHRRIDPLTAARGLVARVRGGATERS
jgi:LAO/AO transport system kinase